jgi:hypothetical protein
MLSYGDRRVLVNSMFAGLPVFMLSFLQIPKGVRKRLDFYRSRVFYQSEDSKRKYWFSMLRTYAYSTNSCST